MLLHSKQGLESWISHSKNGLNQRTHLFAGQRAYLLFELFYEHKHCTTVTSCSTDILFIHSNFIRNIIKSIRQSTYLLFELFYEHKHCTTVTSCSTDILFIHSSFTQNIIKSVKYFQVYMKSFIGS
jgi:hypothetical protein